MAKRGVKVEIKELESAVEEVVGRMGVIERFGKAADHIEGLAEIDTDRFGIAVVTDGGATVTGGEADEPFAIQSISKVFGLTLALQAFGDEVWKRVGREPSGDPFNSIVDLERQKGIPRNPFINPGAIVVSDMLLDISAKSDTNKTVREFLADQIGEDVGIDRKVFDKESSSGFNNRAMANLCKSFGNLNHEVEAVMKPYVSQCAIALSARQLALAGRYLMDGGDKPTDQQRLLARRVNSLMLTCGQYDGSGEFAFRVGLPAKSGVGGGILAIAPGVASIGVWSPGLDDNGNSLLGTLALEQLAERMGWSVFG
ncbi:glutaminase [Neoaquamicrobium sediminum]|uniref:Glutaminase n=1 Tax=Neoaquamicrobium sediminum TaxID=1849104 RepID=A0ABV3WNA8_9HYPH